MENANFCISSFSQHAVQGISQSLINCNPENKKPILICIGSDLVLGDSLGPLVGTLLRKKNVRSFIYGTLNYPITSKEVEYARTYVKQMHPNSVSIAIDAAVGDDNDVGIIRVKSGGLKPGLGVDKKLGIIGDISIIGVVAEKSINNYNLFNLTRLNLIYKMAEKIADGIEEYLNYIRGATEQTLNSSFGA
ncbi:MAG: spore protease YyaC [Clostridia bacterium]|nr:spore protease YyaC [Clostridia bacterium]